LKHYEPNFISISSFLGGSGIFIHTELMIHPTDLK
jgi:hypothetical protein